MKVNNSRLVEEMMAINVKDTLLSRVNELTEIFYTIHCSMQKDNQIQDIVNYYLLFRKTLGHGVKKEKKKEKEEEEEEMEDVNCCHALRKLLKRDAVQEEEEEEEIDWSAMLEAGTDETDDTEGDTKGDTKGEKEEEEEEEEIDWSAMLETGIDESNTTTTNEIIWDIATTTEDITTSFTSSTPSTTTTLPLSTQKERNAILSDLDEILLFLKIRIWEMKEDSNAGDDLLRTIVTTTKENQLTIQGKDSKKV